MDINIAFLLHEFVAKNDIWKEKNLILGLHSLVLERAIRSNNMLENILAPKNHKQGKNTFLVVKKWFCNWKVNPIKFHYF